MAHNCAITGQCPCDSVCGCAVTCETCRSCNNCRACVPLETIEGIEGQRTYATVLAAAHVQRMAAAVERFSAALERLCEILAARDAPPPSS